MEKAGALHDPDNPHNRQLFDQAKAWAESWAGKGAVFASRLDLDEKGGAVVDLMIAPVRESRGKPVISTNKAMGEVKALTDERNEYSALQTSWADWCRDTLDPEIVRGTRKEITRRQHLSPETYGAVLDKARESLSDPSVGLMELMKGVELSEETAQPLSDLLTLKVEVARHKALGRDYAPPQSPMILEHVREDLEGDAWPLINTIRSSAQRVYDAANRFGMGLGKRDDSYEDGREFFPNLLDRMHLAAAVAKCGAFMASVEQIVKHRLRPHLEELDVRQLFPWNAQAHVERHEINLGLIVPQPDHSIGKERDVGIGRDTGYSI